MNKEVKDYIVRVLKTFIQTFIPALCVGIKTLDLEGGKISMAVVISIVIPAVAAGLSAVMNINKLKGSEEDE